MRKKTSKIVLQRETVHLLNQPELGIAQGQVQGCPTLPCTNHVCASKANCTTPCSDGCSSL